MKSVQPRKANHVKVERIVQKASAVIVQVVVVVAIVQAAVVVVIVQAAVVVVIVQAAVVVVIVQAAVVVVIVQAAVKTSKILNRTIVSLLQFLFRELEK